MKIAKKKSWPKWPVFNKEDRLAVNRVIKSNNLVKNLYSPGYKIKVFSSSKIYSDKPNYIFIFAWRYHKNIIVKNKYFKRLGEKFIIPLPNLKIV